MISYKTKIRDISVNPILTLPAHCSQMLMLTQRVKWASVHLEDQPTHRVRGDKTLRTLRIRGAILWIRGESDEWHCAESAASPSRRSMVMLKSVNIFKKCQHKRNLGWWSHISKTKDKRRQHISRLCTFKALSTWPMPSPIWHFYLGIYKYCTCKCLRTPYLT